MIGTLTLFTSSAVNLTSISAGGTLTATVVSTSTNGDAGWVVTINNGALFNLTLTEVVATVPLYAPSISTNAGVDLFTYSTGTWTPTLAGDVTYVTQTGRYVQSGIEVKVSIYVEFNVVTSGTDLSITNLPFATAVDGVGFGVVGQGGMTGVNTVLVARGQGATTDLNFYSPLTETPIVLDNTWGTAIIQGIVTYFI
jgi:hypothetical protein